MLAAVGCPTAIRFLDKFIKDVIVEILAMMPSSSVPNSNIAKHKVLRLLVQTQKRPRCLVYKSIVQDHGNGAGILKIVRCIMLRDKAFIE